MHHRLRSAAIAAAVLSLVNSAHAQSADPAAVVVSASRFEAPLTNAQAIDKTVIGGREIRESGVRSVAEALERFGNVAIRGDFVGAGNRTIDGRGFGDTAMQNTLILLDGVRISENENANAFTAGIPAERIERIEILRGGAGAVAYGEGATGGTINIVTRGVRANTKEVSLRAVAGEQGAGEAAFGARLGTESWALFADGSRRQTDNWRRNNRAESDSLTAGGRLFLTNGEIGASVTREQAEARLPGSLTFAQFQADSRQTFTPNDWTDTGIDRALLWGSLHFGDFDLRVDWSQTERSTDFFTFGTRSRIDAEAMQLSPRLRWRPAGNVELVVGSDFSNWESTRADNNFFAPGTNSASQDARALYVQGVIAFGETRLEAGARHERFDKNNRHSNAAFAYDQTQSSNPWSLALRHDFGPYGVFGRVGRSDRVPNVDENNARTDAALLEVQHSRDLEIGANARRGPLSADLRLFRHRVENEVAFEFPTAGCFGPGCGFGGANRSLPPTKRQGVELEGRWQVVDSLALALRYAALRARFESGTLNGLSVAGNEIPLVARERINLRATWQPLAAHRVELGVQQVSSQRYSGDYNNTLNERIPSYTVWDLGYRFRFKQGDAGATVRNLTDRRYFTVGFGGTGAFGGVYPEAGRTVTADVNLHF